MSNTITSLSQIVRGLVSLTLLGVVGAGGWVAYRVYDDRIELDRELQQKTAELAAKTAQIERLGRENQRLSLALRLLKVDHRVAEITVVDQQPGPERPTTRFRFVEVNGDGHRNLPSAEPQRLRVRHPSRRRPLRPPPSPLTPSQGVNGY